MNRKYTLEIVKQIFLDSQCELLEESYKDPKQRLRYICNCKSVCYTTLDSFVSGRRCKACGIKKRAQKRRKSYESVQNDCILRNLKLITSEQDYALIPTGRNNHKIKIECLKGHVVEMKADSLSKSNYNGKCKRCLIEESIGEGNRNYKHGLSKEQREARNFNRAPEEKWRNLVYNRDGWKCGVCEKKGLLNAHHINSYNWDKENRFNPDNGITLCGLCHKEFHKIYGRGDNTLNQFLDYVNKKGQRLSTLADVITERLTKPIEEPFPHVS